jgi:hypothetical protein
MRKGEKKKKNSATDLDRYNTEGECIQQEDTGSKGF